MFGTVLPNNHNKARLTLIHMGVVITGLHYFICEQELNLSGGIKQSSINKLGVITDLSPVKSEITACLMSAWPLLLGTISYHPLNPRFKQYLLIYAYKISKFCELKNLLVLNFVNFKGA
jgi:hypothetical protein